MKVKPYSSFTIASERPTSEMETVFPLEWSFYFSYTLEAIVFPKLLRLEREWLWVKCAVSSTWHQGWLHKKDRSEETPQRST